MKLIGQGRTAEIYHYADDLILKLYRTGFSGEAVQNEYRMSQWVYEKGLPVPRAVKQMHHATRTGILFERFEGTTLLSLMIQQPELLEHLSYIMAATHYKVHMVQDEGNLLPSQKKILEHAMLRVSLFSDLEHERLIHYLSVLPEQRAICHGDYHPDNVMLSKDGEQHCVIDWMTGMAGDPAGDVARTWVILKSGKSPDDAEPAIQGRIRASSKFDIGAVYSTLHRSFRDQTWAERCLDVTCCCGTFGRKLAFLGRGVSPSVCAGQTALAG